MTRPNRHRIQRQILELTVETAAECPAVHQALARPFWARAVSELEQVFDRAAGPDELLRLDRLELDLGAIGGGEWPSEFRRRLVAELTRALAQFKPAAEPASEGPGNRRPAESWRGFLFFLLHGRLPWWVAARTEPWSALLPDLSDADWNALRETVLPDERARSRFAYSVDDEFLERAVAAWSGVREAARALRQLTPKHRGADAQRQWRRGFWMLVLDRIAKGGFRSSQAGPRLLRELMILRDMCEPETGLRTFHPSADDAGRRGDRTPTAEDFDLPQPWRGWLLAQDDQPPFDPDAAEPPPSFADRTTDAPAGSPRKRASQKSRREADEDAIYLPGAGAILVHPFLTQLFRERGLLEGRAFRGLEARNRAVQLIGFLTFGRLDVEEYELVLAKALCGVELEEPLEPAPLADDDIAACEALLRAVLTHWTALRSGSPQWLREQFFLREGKLQRVDSGWLLTIERHAQDVLLARLPWGCGVVEPPWLGGRIFVHWIE
jgi:hypothetical protein